LLIFIELAGFYCIFEKEKMTSNNYSTLDDAFLAKAEK